MIKTQVKNEENQLTLLFIVSACFASLNGFFYQEQYLNVNPHYASVFTILPIASGLILLVKIFPAYITHYTDLKSKRGKFFMRLFLLVMGSMISFCSIGTMANILFKLTFHFTSSQTSTSSTYPIIKFSKARSYGRYSGRYSRFTINYHGKEVIVNTESPQIIHSMDSIMKAGVSHH